MLPLVSVVCPIFNGEKYLSEAIDSVLGQTCDSWELLLIDDGSRDSSLEIAKSYAAMNPGRIHCFNHLDHGNHGTAATRNLGISRSKGKYIANLDQDDFFVAHKLAEQVPVLERNCEAAMTFGPMLIWNSWNTGASSDDMPQEFTINCSAYNRQLDSPTFVPYLFSGKNDPHGYLARKDALVEVGGYAEGLGTCEDWGMYLKMTLRYPIFMTEQPVYKYRQHGDQACRHYRDVKSFYSSFVPFYRWAESYLVSQNVEDSSIWRSLRAAILRNNRAIFSESGVQPVHDLSSDTLKFTRKASYPS